MKIAIFSCVLIGMLLVLLPLGYSMLGLCFLFLAFLLIISKHRKLFASVLASSILILLLLEIPIWQNARTDAPPNVDYIIVLGAAVNGTEPSLSLLDRLDTATQFLYAHPNCKVVVSGGQGNDEDISEAQAMFDYLSSHGIASSRILLEPNASNTEENIKFSLSLIHKETTTPIVAVVSSEYHLYRAKWIGKQLGYDLYGIAAPTSYFLLKINYFLREALAMVKVYLL